MKRARTIVFALGLSMVFSLLTVGCGGKSDSGENSTAGKTAEEQQMRKDKKGDE